VSESSTLRHLEATLRTRQRIAELEARQRAAEVTRWEAARREREWRWSVPMRFALPVERAIRVYEDPRTTLYDVLRLSRRRCDPEALRAAHRALALSVHPGTYTLSL
jgi:hypothetical protein